MNPTGLRGSMVAVGTRIPPRPHRSRRALLTHRAPPSGQASCDERSSVDHRPARSHLWGTSCVRWRTLSASNRWPVRRALCTGSDTGRERMTVRCARLSTASSLPNRTSIRASSVTRRRLDVAACSRRLVQAATTASLPPTENERITPYVWVYPQRIGEPWALRERSSKLQCALLSHSTI